MVSYLRDTLPPKAILWRVYIIKLRKVYGGEILRFSPLCACLGRKCCPWKLLENGQVCGPPLATRGDTSVLVGGGGGGSDLNIHKLCSARQFFSVPFLRNFLWGANQIFFTKIGKYLDFKVCQKPEEGCLNDFKFNQ